MPLVLEIFISATKNSIPEKPDSILYPKKLKTAFPNL